MNPCPKKAACKCVHRNNISFLDHGENIIDLYIQPLFIIHETVQREQLASITTLKLFIIHAKVIASRSNFLLHYDS